MQIISLFIKRTDDRRIHQDPSAIFANDDLLVHADIELVLWRDLIEASAAGIPFDLHDGKAVAGIFPDPLVCDQQPVLDPV